MFEAYFQLRENPFSLAPDPKFLYRSAEHDEALAHLRYWIENAEGFVLITGEVGTGKTTALYDLLAQIPTEWSVAFLSHSTLSELELLHEVCRRFHIEVAEGATKPTLLGLLEDYLNRCRAQNQGALLIIDEAQNLEMRLLEEIRLLSNMERLDGKLLQIALVGQPELEEKLRRPELRQLRQRIGIKYCLRPLSENACIGYVHHRLTVAGGNAHVIFPYAAALEVYRITGGIPREVNVVASQALINAYVAESPQVLIEHVRAVLEDFQFESITGRPQAERGQPLERRARTERRDAPPAAPEADATPPMPPAQPAVDHDAAGRREGDSGAHAALTAPAPPAPPAPAPEAAPVAPEATPAAPPAPPAAEEMTPAVLEAPPASPETATASSERASESAPHPQETGRRRMSARGDYALPAQPIEERPAPAAVPTSARRGSLPSLAPEKKPSRRSRKWLGRMGRKAAPEEPEQSAGAIEPAGPDAAAAAAQPVATSPRDTSTRQLTRKEKRRGKRSQPIVPGAEPVESAPSAARQPDGSGAPPDLVVAGRIDGSHTGSRAESSSPRPPRLPRRHRPSMWPWMLIAVIVIILGIARGSHIVSWLDALGGEGDRVQAPVIPREIGDQRVADVAPRADPAGSAGSGGTAAPSAELSLATSHLSASGETASFGGEPGSGESDGELEERMQRQFGTAGDYVVHVASFRQLDRADRLRDKLQQALSYEVEIVPADVGGESWYRVYIGRFANRQDAAQAATEARERNLVGPTVIMRRSGVVSR